MKLYNALVRSVLDIGRYITSPGHKGDVQLVEGVQRRATKAITKMREKPYDEGAE